MNDTVISPLYDPWEAYLDVEEHGKLTLSNVEFTTTHLCNMRCEHCAVGHDLKTKEEEAFPLSLLIEQLDAIPHLRTLSITGGEPLISNVDEYVVPLLKYAHERNVKTQINSNLTLPWRRLEKIVPYIDVVHISHNWIDADDFATVGFHNMERKPPMQKRHELYHRMFENAKKLNEAGVLVAAETMLNKRTIPHLEKIHQEVIEMGCRRHEIHPMYPSDFASEMETASLEELRETIHHLLDIRHKPLWMMFGTLPFYGCSKDERDLQLIQRLHDEPNVTVRNDPDGRSRLNVNIFTGEIIVTDFGDFPILGNIQTTTLTEAFDQWLQRDCARQLHCHCPEIKCLGPNPLVKGLYYPNTDFNNRHTKLSFQEKE